MSSAFVRSLSLAAIATVLATPAAGGRFAGEWSNAYTGAGGAVRFVGQLRAGATTIRGRIRCPRCPVRGRVQISCTSAGGPSSGCTGTTARGCTVSGVYYGTQFEGQYDCGGDPIGVLSFGRR